MSRSNESEGGRLARRDIIEIRRTVKRVRHELYTALNHQRSIPDSVKRDLREAVLKYWDALHEYDEDAKDLWQDNELDAIPVLARETTTVKRKKPGYGPHYEWVEVPKIRAVDIWTLWDYTLELDRIAKELKFAAPSPDKTPEDDADMSDLRGLLKARGQTEALENLPDPEPEEPEVNPDGGRR